MSKVPFIAFITLGLLWTDMAENLHSGLCTKICHVREFQQNVNGGFDRHEEGFFCIR
jgi:hypothetical protein